MKIQCRTLFDCSYSGVTGHYRVGSVPFQDHNGRDINSHQDWNYSRNQQRNFETIIQMISLRAQPDITRRPHQVENLWQFEFEIETPGVYSNNGDVNNLDGLLNECDGIPMVIGLGETTELESCLITKGENQNIWFTAINTSLE